MDAGTQKVQTTCLLLLTATVVAAALHFLSGVLVPFVLSLFLAIGLWPVIDLQIRRLRFPRTIAVISTMLLGAALLFLLGMLVTSSVNQMLDNQDVYTEKIEKLWDDGEAILRDLRLLPREEEDKPAGSGEAGAAGGEAGEKQQPEEDVEKRPAEDGGGAQDGAKPVQERDVGELIRENIRDVLVGLLSDLLGILSQGVVVLIFLLFLLTGRDPTEDRPTGYWAEVEHGVRRYLQVKVAVSAMTGVLVGATLMILGVDLALVFAVFTFLLNFIPNVGSIIAMLLPVPVVLISDLSAPSQVLAIAIPAAIQFAVGNVLEPRWMGRSLDIHPVVVLLALIFWGTLWGMVGVILAVPVTAALKILLEKAEATAPVARWMAGGPG